MINFIKITIQCFQGFYKRIIMEKKMLILDGLVGKYDIYSNGTIYSYQKKRFLPLHSNGKGYFAVNLNFVDGYKRKYIHRLVAISFIDNFLSLPDVNHKDCNKENNNVSNLEWASRKENIQHAFTNDRFTKIYDNMASNQSKWIGKRVNKRTVISVTGEKNKGGNYKVIVLCDCSNTLSMYYNDFIKARHTVCRKCKYKKGNEDV